MITVDKEAEVRERVLLHNALVGGVQLDAPGVDQSPDGVDIGNPTFYAHDDLEDSPLWRDHQRRLQQNAMSRRN